MAEHLSPLRTYRILLRAARRVFRGDTHALMAARMEARNQFESNRHETNQDRIAQLCRDGEEAASFLEQSIIQGQQNDATGNIDLHLESRHTEATMERDGHTGGEDNPVQMHVITSDKGLIEAPEGKIPNAGCDGGGGGGAGGDDDGGGKTQWMMTRRKGDLIYFTYIDIL